MNNNSNIKLYSHINNNVHQFCIGVYIKAGCLYEPDDINGITHLFEHIVFRNIKKHFSKDFYEMLTEKGLSFDASTYKEFLYFSISGLPMGIPLALEIISYLFEDISVNREEFETEKKRVKAEIRESSEKNTLAYMANKEVWNGTSLTNTILGTCKTIDSISVKKLNDYKNTVFNKNNVFVYLTGNINPKEINEIENTISNISISQADYVNDNKSKLPLNFFKRNLTIIKKNAPYYRIKICFDVNNSICPVEVRDILYSILFEEENALVFQEISENNPYVYSYNATFEQYSNISVLDLEYEVSKKNFENSIVAIVNVLNRIKSGDFNFEINLQKLLTKWELVQDNICDLNWCLAYENHILCNNIIDLNKSKFARFSNLTKEQVILCADKIFKTSNLTLSVKGNKTYLDSIDFKHLFKDLDT